MGVLQAYQKAINGTKLAGPTYFGKYLALIENEILENIKYGHEKNREYHLAIIITDGACHDMIETRRLLVNMSGMPFSSVIVGVSVDPENEDFADMEKLDADEEVLKDEHGRAAVRDIVQLVKYNDFKDLGMRELALEVLGEVPDQFVDYMVMMKVTPDQLHHVEPLPMPKDKSTPEGETAN